MTSSAEHGDTAGRDDGSTPPGREPGHEPSMTGNWSYIGLLREYRSLRSLWLGKVVSLAGDWFNTIALYEAVRDLSSSALAVTLVMVAKTLPIFVMAPVAGPLVDRLDRRVLLIATDITRATCGVALIAAHFLDWLPGLYAATVLMMMGTGVAFPASQAALPMIVPSHRIPMANALLGGTWSIMLALGAALGGIATQTLGVTAAFSIDIATFLVSAIFFARLPPLPAPAKQVAERAGAVAEKTGFRDGLRYLRRHPYILCLASLKPMMQIYGGVLALVPLYGSGVFQGVAGPFFVGLLYAVRGLGAAIGSLVLRAVFGDDVRTMRRLILVAYFLAGASYVGLAHADVYWHAAVAYFLSAVGQSTIWVFSGSLIQLEADRRFHGRVFAIETGVGMFSLAASSYVIGVILDSGLALDRTVLGFAALALLPIALWGTVVWRRGRSDAATATSDK